MNVPSFDNMSTPEVSNEGMKRRRWLKVLDEVREHTGRADHPAVNILEAECAVIQRELDLRHKALRATMLGGNNR
jgi:hypothetical protein